MLKKKNSTFTHKGYYRYLISYVISVFRKKNEDILEYYNYKKSLKNEK